MTAKARQTVGPAEETAEWTAAYVPLGLSARAGVENPIQRLMSFRLRWVGLGDVVERRKGRRSTELPDPKAKGMPPGAGFSSAARAVSPLRPQRFLPRFSR